MSDQSSPSGPPPARARRANRLASETSPYLLQHAFNPVDWRPWGQDAFDEARRRDVPIFLSVGYSTCYWCHVMERESFEHEPTARQMNEGFVCIKVDREERPDVDDLYMAATQAFTGRGGWPMNLVLEPSGLRPFWAGTYFPIEPRYGMPSFRQILAGVKQAWADQREQALSQADALADAVAEHLASKAAPVALGADQVAGAVTTLLRIHDRAHGGFGQGGPKFPQPSYIDLLLAFRQVAQDEETQRAVDAAVRTTLDKMACGGMHDQVGGGFHRYSVDEKWLVPHFEKMLYDNGQLAQTYATAASMYNDAFYARTAQRTVDYILREMTSSGEGGGAFYSAQDAEVNHREGQNYLWTREQLTEVLGPDDAAFAAKVYGVDQGENFRDPHHPHDPPSNVLFLAARPEIVAAQHNMPVEPFLARLDAMNEKLYAARQKRDQPHRDEKFLSGWNGMMIAGMAVASVVLDEQRYAAAAQRAADFVLSRMREADAGLLRAFGGAGEAARAHIPAFLDDYAFMVHGLLQLQRALSARGHDDATYLAAARELAAEAQQKFGDAAGGAYFDTRADQPDLFIRGRSTYDGAVPSGVSVMLNDLIDLYEQTGDETSLDRAAAGLSAISAAIAESPVATVNSTRALLRMLVTRPGEARIKALAENAAPAPATNPAAPDVAQPLEVYASTDRVAVKPDEPAGFILEVVLAEGDHVLAADPGQSAAGLTGLRLDVVNGSGVAVYADWPEGDPYGPDGKLRAYTGRLSVPVILERQGDWSGRPILALRYQVCTETECLPPGAVELAVAIDRG